jgi:hypothetical protein
VILLCFLTAGFSAVSLLQDLIPLIAIFNGRF